MAQSEDPRMEKLLLHELQPEKISEAGLVYIATVNPMVREEQATQKMDGFNSRGQIYRCLIWIKNDVVICMPMDEKHRKAV